MSGTLSFRLLSGSCDPAVGTVVYEEDTDPNTAGVQPFTLTNASTAAERTKATSNTTFRVTQGTPAANVTYYWRIVFTPASSFVTGFTKCEKTDININDNPAP